MPPRLVQRVLVPAGFIFLWSSAYIVVRMGLPDMSPIASLALRFAVATVVLVILARAMGPPLTVLGNRWPHFAVAGALMNGIYPRHRLRGASVSRGGHHGTPRLPQPHADGAPGLGPARRAHAASQWLGLGLGVAGVVLVVGRAPMPGQSVAAALLAVSGIVAFAMGTIYFRRHCGSGALLAGNAVQMARRASSAPCSRPPWRRST